MWDQLSMCYAYIQHSKSYINNTVKSSILKYPGWNDTDVACERTIFVNTAQGDPDLMVTLQDEFKHNSAK